MKPGRRTGKVNPISPTARAHLNPNSREQQPKPKKKKKKNGDNSINPPGVGENVDTHA